MIRNHAPAASRSDLEIRKVHQPDQAVVGPGWPVEAERGQLVEGIRDHGPRGIDQDPGFPFGALGAPQVQLEADRAVAGDRDGLQALDSFAEEAGRANQDLLVGPSPGDPVHHRELDLPREELPPELRRQVIGGPSSDERGKGFAVQPGDDHLRPPLVQGQPSGERFDQKVGPVPVKDQAMRLLSGNHAPHLQAVPQAPEAQEADSVLALGHEPEPFLGGERALAAVSDAGGDVAQRVGPVHLGNHAFSVVKDPKEWDLPFTAPLDGDPGRSRVEAVLDQLGQSLSRVGLAESQPSNELEGIVRANLAAQHRTPGGTRLPFGI